MIVCVSRTNGKNKKCSLRSRSEYRLLANPVRNLDEAIEKANPLAYGLAAYAFTRSAHNADRLANDVDGGNFSINYFVASVAETPFEGVKDGGCGREELHYYTFAKNVSHKTI